MGDISSNTVMLTKAIFLQVFFCNIYLVRLAPAPQPFVDPVLLPVVARSITSSLPTLIVPSLGLTIPAVHLVAALATKGLLLASLSLGAILGKAKTAIERSRRSKWRSRRRSREASTMSGTRENPQQFAKKFLEYHVDLDLATCHLEPEMQK